MLYNHFKLRWQHDWRGAKLANLKFLVCEICLDEPQRQLGILILPPDPMPIMNARPEQYSIDETSNLSTQDNEGLVTQDDEEVVSAPIPAPEEE